MTNHRQSQATTARPPRVLLTGFGPFPGVATNMSFAFARAIAGQLSQSRPSLVIETEELAVEWQAIEDQVRALHKAVAPDLAVHFGVSTCIDGIVVEDTAHNACAQEIDHRGLAPPKGQLVRDAPNKRTTALNVDALIAETANVSNITVTQSHDAGRYLCNAAYFLSLACTERDASNATALFIHIPHELAPDTDAWRPSVVQTTALLSTALSQL